MALDLVYFCNLHLPVETFVFGESDGVKISHPNLDFDRVRTIMCEMKNESGNVLPFTSFCVIFSSLKLGDFIGYFEKLRLSSTQQNSIRVLEPVEPISILDSLTLLNSTTIIYSRFTYTPKCCM